MIWSLRHFSLADWEGECVFYPSWSGCDSLLALEMSNFYAFENLEENFGQILKKYLDKKHENVF